MFRFQYVFCADLCIVTRSGQNMETKKKKSNKAKHTGTDETREATSDDAMTTGDQQDQAKLISRDHQEEEAQAEGSRDGGHTEARTNG